MKVILKKDIPSYLIAREMYTEKFLNTVNEFTNLLPRQDLPKVKWMKTLTSELNKRRKKPFEVLSVDEIWYYTEDFYCLPVGMCEIITE